MLNRIINHMDEPIGHSLLQGREKQKAVYVAAATPEIKDVV
jgi:hypothetical protein